ncbi:TetR/AcrR family transcriptional regulator [Acidaminobacter sp. JC074]|uniref:TetR/AcrR family transcriptional regulator n=1 Tax=Acidaminobacter sp. JC074 TaxID=2530199 RepID=UPI001F1166E9|nr:TetR/AcrR family transcriptional regulator [Acidaminobacter sp. JC074]MCH4887429.1 TetR/AcrR family transcriptional regulator [Acidaminobacter sp. JC074]
MGTSCKKALIYDTTLKMLKNKDYMSITIRKICESAGISVGTFYIYYKSKDEIIEELFEEMTHEMNFDVTCQQVNLSGLNQVCHQLIEVIIQNKILVKAFFVSKLFYEKEACKDHIQVLIEPFIIKHFSEELVDLAVNSLSQLIKGLIYEWIVSYCDDDILLRGKETIDDYILFLLDRKNVSD